MSRFEETNFGLDTKKPYAYWLLHRCYHWPFRGVIALKYTLKNRPKSVVTKAGTFTVTEKSFDAWFKGFEKELREIVKKTPTMKCCKEHYTCGYVDMAKEILGE